MRRGLIWAVSVVAVLVALDFILASVAEYQVSSSLKQQLSLPEEPAVRVTGFPFLTQAIRGDYRRVDVAAEYVGVGALRNAGMFAELFHVRVPMSDVLSGSVRNVTVESVASSVLITKEDLAKLLNGISKLTVSPVTDATLDEATINAKDALPGSSVTGVNPAEAVQMSGDMTVMGKKARVSIIAALRLTDGQIDLVPKDIRLSGADATQLPPETQVALRATFSLTINPGSLPFSLAPTRLRAAGDGIAISGTGHNLVLAPSSQRSSS